MHYKTTYSLSLSHILNDDQNVTDSEQKAHRESRSKRCSRKSLTNIVSSLGVFDGIVFFCSSVSSK